MSWGNLILETIVIVTIEVYLLFYFVQVKEYKQKKIFEILGFLSMVGIVLILIVLRSDVFIKLGIVFFSSTLILNKLYHIPIRKLCVDVALYEFSVLVAEIFVLGGLSYIERAYIFEPCYGGVKIRTDIAFFTKFTSFIILFLVKKFRGLSGRKLSFQELISMFLPIFFSIVVLCTIGITVMESDTELLKTDYRVIGIIFVAIVFSSVCNLIISEQFIKAKEEEYRDKMRILQIESQYQYFTERQKDEKNVQRMYHDLKNHLLILQKEVCTTAETNEYISAILTNIKPYENYYETGNRFLNIIINEKLKQAKANNINMEILVDFTNMEGMDPMDISTLFGNALDNAIEASCKIEQERRFIILKARWYRENMVIKVENNHNNKLLFLEGKIITTKENKKMHGFGTENIKIVVEKYGGNYKVLNENGIFSLIIMLPRIKMSN